MPQAEQGKISPAREHRQKLALAEPAHVVRCVDGSSCRRLRDAHDMRDGLRHFRPLTSDSRESDLDSVSHEAFLQKRARAFGFRPRSLTLEGMEGRQRVREPSAQSRAAELVRSPDEHETHRSRGFALPFFTLSAVVEHLRASDADGRGVGEISNVDGGRSERIRRRHLEAPAGNHFEVRERA
jgi:hypothetical protein